MNNGQIQIIGISPQEIFEKFEKKLNDFKLELTKQFQPKQPTEYLTRAEVCELLQIDLSTLHSWRKKYILTAYGIGNRVYFKRSEIEDLINKNKI